MQASVTQSYPAGGGGYYPINVNDGGVLDAAGLIVAQTKGASLIASLPGIQLVAPGPTARWAILAFSIRAQLLVLNTSDTWFGKWGKITAGLTKQLPTGTAVLGINDPQDPSLVTTLWDPEQDPLPPQNNTSPAPASSPLIYLPVTATQQLPQPIEIQPGMTPPNMGLWVAPSVLGCNKGALQMAVYNAEFTLIYDDESLGS